MAAHRGAGRAPASMPTEGPSPGRLASFNRAYFGANGATVSYTAMRHNQDGYITDNGRSSATRFALSAACRPAIHQQFGAQLFGLCRRHRFPGYEQQRGGIRDRRLRRRPHRQGDLGKIELSTARSAAASACVTEQSLIYVARRPCHRRRDPASATVLPFADETFSTATPAGAGPADQHRNRALSSSYDLVYELLYIVDKANDRSTAARSSRIATSASTTRPASVRRSSA